VQILVITLDLKTTLATCLALPLITSPTIQITFANHALRLVEAVQVVTSLTALPAPTPHYILTPTGLVSIPVTPDSTRKTVIIPAFNAPHSAENAPIMLALVCPVPIQISS